MGYTLLAYGQDRRIFGFQFPLWDTLILQNFDKVFQLFFQFPLWDTYAF